MNEPNYRKASAVVPDSRSPGEVSWLGRWQDCGWAIQIFPRLTDKQWERYGRRSEECWDPERFRYDPARSLEVLQELFPAHELRLTWPKCTYRERSDRGARVPVFTQCNARAEYTEVRAFDVHGAQVGIPRCDRHQGLL